MNGKKNLISSNEITHIGIVVRDIEQTIKKYAEIFGMAPPDIMTTAKISKSHAEYKGKPLEGRAKLAFLKFQNLSIELMEPIEGESTWQEHLDTYGEGVHHISFNVSEKEKVIQNLAKKQIHVAQKGDFEGGSFTNMDSKEDLKIVLEFLEFNNP
jgi:methylmalonyl-CoA/ethylmalonyl-CoA epimerase